MHATTARFPRTAALPAQCRARLRTLFELGCIIVLGALASALVCQLIDLASLALWRRG